MEMNMAERIMLLRRKLDLTQRDLANLAGISQKQISLIERGKATAVHAETIVRLAGVFKVSTDFLLCVTDKIERRANVRAAGVV